MILGQQEFAVVTDPNDDWYASIIIVQRVAGFFTKYKCRLHRKYLQTSTRCNVDINIKKFKIFPGANGEEKATELSDRLYRAKSMV